MVFKYNNGLSMEPSSGMSLFFHEMIQEEMSLPDSIGQSRNFMSEIDRPPAYPESASWRIEGLAGDDRGRWHLGFRVLLEISWAE